MKMKTKTIQLISALTIMISSTVYAAEGHQHEPMFGGVVTVVKDIDYELVVKPDSISLYVIDHGKIVDVSNASAKLTLLSGADKQEVTLKPAGDQLQVNGSFKTTDTKAVALVSQVGKPAVAVRFVIK
jgi:hypothetical protein